MAYYISPKGAVPDSGFYEFEKTVSVSENSVFTVNIFASSRYILYINHKYICEGPCRGDSETRYYDSVKTDFNAGENHILVKVLHQTKNFTSVFKTEKPVLLFEAVSEKEHFLSDKTWGCSLLENHKPFYDKSPFLPPGAEATSFLPPSEEISAEVKKAALEAEEVFFFENINLDFSENCSYNRFGISLMESVTKRPIPMIYPAEEISLSIVKEGENFMELDAGEYTTARVYFDFAKNADIKIIYSECYEFEDGKRLRDDTSGFLNGYFDIVHTKDTDFHYETFWFRAFRYIRIETNNPKAALKSIKARRISYPLDIKGSFTCSDESYNKMVPVSYNTLLCCMHEIFVDCPHYEQQQYIMDSAIECAVLRCISPDVKMIKKCIADFAQSQHKNGLLSANYPSTYIQIIPGFSIFWIDLLKDYLNYSADIEFVKNYTGVMDRILLYFDSQFEKNGCVTTSPYWDYVDWVPTWYDGTIPVKEGEAITIYNLYYAYGLKCAAYICEKTGRFGLADEYKDRYEKLKKAINERCFDESRNLYRDGSQTATYSAHTIVWAILSEVVPKDKEKELASHLFDKDISKCSFSMNYYVFRALEKCGMYHKAETVLSDWQKMLDWHCTTWCENPDNPRSECHAWSSAPVYEFSTNILGVKHTFEDIITIKPYTGSLKFAKGVVSTRHGEVSVNWENSESGFKISIKAPDNIEKQLTLPSGETHIFTGKTFEI